jgi:hypothetical protein
MKFWEMSGQEGALVGFVPDEKLSMAMTHCGINPVAVRNALHLAKADPVDMQLGEHSAATVRKEKQVIPDLVFWSWIAIFSDRATTTAIEFDCEPDEFWPCRFQSNPGEQFFFHLPTRCFDIVDIEKSAFRQILPLNPPIPMFIERLAVKQFPDHLPPCFRAKIPRTKQVFSELLIRDDFKLAWEQRAFRGAKFRQLSA